MCREAENLAERQARNAQAAGPMDAILNKMCDEELEIVKKMFNTAYFVMHYEMPWTSYPNLLDLQIKNGSNLNRLTSYHTDKGCARFGTYIADAIREPIQDALRNAKSIAIMFDGATDCSVSEVEIIYCRVVKDGLPTDFFISLEDLEHAHSQGAYDAINSAMTKFGCPDWLDKVVGIGSDGASVNVGRKNSVKTRFLEERPYIVVTHCVAHRLELGVLSAIKDNDMLTTVKDILLKVHKHYHYSPKALRELKTIAEAMEERCIKPKRLQGTRWLPHIMKASKALMDGYIPLRAHFEHVSQAGPNQATAEVKGRATYLANKLKDYRVLRFMVFLEDLLEIVSALSLKFQSNSLTCVDYLDALETANLMLVQLGQQPGDYYRAFTANILQTDDGDWEYRGHKLSHYQPHDYNFNNIIDSVMERMNGRLENQDPVLSQARVFDCKDWPRDRLELAVYGNDEVAALTRHFTTMLTRRQCDIAAIPNEWTQVKAHLGRRMVNNPRVLPSITEIFPLDEMFGNLLHLVEIILTLPISTAVCERGFSAVKRIKSDWRASLTTDTMTDLLAVSIEGPTLEAYNAERAVHLWWTRGQRSRRPQFDGPDDVVDEDDL